MKVFRAASCLLSFALVPLWDHPRWSSVWHEDLINNSQLFELIHLPLDFFSNLSGVLVWDKPAAMLQNRLYSHCTTGALHNKMRITLQLFYRAISSCASPFPCCRFLSSLLLSCAAPWNPRPGANVSVKKAESREPDVTWKTLLVSDSVSSRHTLHRRSKRECLH